MWPGWRGNRRQRPTSFDRETTERILTAVAGESLPYTDPKASYSLAHTFGDRPGVEPSRQLRATQSPRAADDWWNESNQIAFRHARP